MSYNTMPTDLPQPEDDGAADHLTGMALPDLALQSTDGRIVRLTALPAGRTVLYFYPMTGVPGTPLPDGWDAIPGARGCTPEALAFKDHATELAELGAGVFGVSTQTTEYQQELAERLHLPFAILSDRDFALATALRLPMFEVAGMTLHKRLTLVARDGVIEKIFYPVFPSDQAAAAVIAWLKTAD